MEIIERNLGESSRNYALRTLNYNIVSVKLPPGISISENEIASALNLSRTPVREALIELSKNNLVTIRPQKSSLISKINCKAIEEARFIRLALETAVLKQACVDIPPMYIIKLHGNLSEQKAALDNNDYIRLLKLDNLFHKLIFEAVGRVQSYTLLSTQMIHFDRLRVLTIKSLENDRTLSDHQAILSAIENHDKNLAETFLISHLARHNLNRDELIKMYPDYFE